MPPWHLRAWLIWLRRGESQGVQMLIFRLVFGLLVLASVLCFAMAIGTRQPIWRQRGLIILKWTVLAGLGFFGVVILERLALLL